MVNRVIDEFVSRTLSRYPSRTLLSRYAERSIAHGLLAAHEILVEALVPTLNAAAADALTSVVMDGASRGDAACEAQLRLLLQRSKNNPANVAILVADEVTEAEARALGGPARTLIQMLVMAGDAGATADVRAVLIREASSYSVNRAAQLACSILDDAIDEVAAVRHG
ncbi:hypothetical protein FHE66_06680 [Georgenia sp. 311]|uniref:hypothetical protein n=1 Tax=Georgenia sp. 311 TaxID=2585134 RepID=UPI001111C598|nr:hypothetical protein [Georgenia sp. 311]TNC18468.1 hypothetical protein FHE66_06680 [Georgenia sp. 311]